MMTRKEAKAALRSIKNRSVVNGLVLPDDGAKIRWPHRKLRSVTFKNCDFRHVLMGGLISRGVYFTACEFSSVDLDGLNIDRCRFFDCSFRNVTFGRGYHGLIRRTQFTGCSMKACKISRVQFLACTFSNCDAVRLSGTRAMFQRCSLSHCDFSGRPPVLHFVNCGFDSTSLEDLNTNDLCVVNPSGELPILPSNGNHEVLYYEG